MATETEIGRSPSGRAAAADAVEPVPVSSKASIPNAFTPGPWYVRDLSAATMRKLGWTGPSIDRILITNKTGAEIIRDEGEDCVIARNLRSILAMRDPWEEHIAYEALQPLH
jgi:hypothetical protein